MMAPGRHHGDPPVVPFYGLAAFAGALARATPPKHIY
jgi:hypothetical protein